MNLSDAQIQNTAPYWPNNSQLRQNLSIPLALSFYPTSQQINNASFNQKNVDKYRCQSCKAFINKYCLVRSQNQYDCSLCGFSNHIDGKLDTNSPQLSFSSYKCKALKIQRTVMSKQRVFIFILDFSNYSELSQKYLLYSIHVIRQFVNQAIKQKKNFKIMLLGFDDGIQIFNLKDQIQRLVFCDDDADTSIVDYPFTTDQICLLSECIANFLLILQTLEQQINQRKFRNNTSSKRILQVIQYALKYTKSESGKIFLVSGLTHQLQKFKVMRNYDSTVQDFYKHHYSIVKKECLSQNLQNLLSSTQMSVSLFFHKNFYCNLMPFHIITKSTNGDLRQYLNHQTDHFFYEFNFMLHQILYQMKFQTLLRVRAGIGLKLVGIFGNYRPWKGIAEQVQILSCETNKKYVFEFIVQGKINSPFTVVQFSVLYTDLKGNRYSKIITQKVDLSSQLDIILPEINYQVINTTYLKAILHNMQITPHFQKLQIALQDRCKKHIRLLRQIQLFKKSQKALNNQDLLQQRFMNKARSYVIFTFMLMKHFLLNLHPRRDIYLDINIEARSKLSSFDENFKIIWPILYAVNQEGTHIIQMKIENFDQGTQGIVIDRGDAVYVFIRNQELKNTLRLAKDLRKAIRQTPQLTNISNLLDEIEDKKSFPHLKLTILQLNNIMNFNIFSQTGTQSFPAFISHLLQN